MTTPSTTPPVRVERRVLGPMQNFVYLLIPAAQERLLVVDPAWEPEVLLEQARILQRPITDIVLTHHHPDHVNGVDAILERFSPRIHIQRSELGPLQGKGWGAHLVLHESGDTVDLGAGQTLQLLHTPGHTPGSQCIRVGTDLLTGDTMFIDGCGRCDLPGGDPAQMFHTLSRILDELPGSTRVLPGHDYAPSPEATLDEQRKSNPYLKFDDLQGFVRYRMRPRT